MDTTAIIDIYLDAYGETDADRRRQLISEAFTDGATLTDPPLDATGHDALSDMFVAVQGQFPDHTFTRTSNVDEHHGAARYEWSLTAPDGTIAVTGTDFVRFGADNKLASVFGFFGPIPQLDQ